MMLIVEVEIAQLKQKFNEMVNSICRYRIVSVFFMKKLLASRMPWIDLEGRGYELETSMVEISGFDES